MIGRPISKQPKLLEPVDVGQLALLLEQNGYFILSLTSHANLAPHIRIASIRHSELLRELASRYEFSFTYANCPYIDINGWKVIAYVLEVTIPYLRKKRPQAEFMLEICQARLKGESLEKLRAKVMVHQEVI